MSLVELAGIFALYEAARSDPAGTRNFLKNEVGPAVKGLTDVATSLIRKMDVEPALCGGGP